MKFASLIRPTPSDRSPTPLTAHDDGLIWAIALLLSIGFVMVYSASIAYAEADPDTHNRYFYLIRHGVYLTISLIVSWIVFHIPSRIWQEKAPYLFVGAFILLILVLVPGIGKVVNGSRRWINLVVLNLQPSELALCDIEDSGIWPDVCVLELSSFQLEGVRSLRADAATVLNISEDHLDRYQDLLDYAHSKTAIFAGDGVQVINQDDVFCRAMVRPGRAVRRFSLTQPTQYGLCREGQSIALAVDGEPVLDVAQMQLTGLHNAANALAALALCEAIGLDRASLLAGLCRFKGLAHRVEHVLQLNGVDFYDDSKGTNVGATEAALNGMSRPVVLIAGGDGKGQDFTPLAAAVARIARAVLLIGRDAERIEAALAAVSVPVHRADTLEDATRLAYQAAQPGDVVLLSPACASLDMFRNYAHRAEVFIASARQLADEARL